MIVLLALLAAAGAPPGKATRTPYCEEGRAAVTETAGKKPVTQKTKPRRTPTGKTLQAEYASMRRTPAPDPRTDCPPNDR